jgi:methylenetetrahydrofolate reductase (NADPH)
VELEFHTAESALAALLQRPRFEVIPLDGIEDEVRAHVPPGARVAVSASPRRGLEGTLALTERFATAGYNAIPHVSARLVRDGAHLDEVLDRVLAAGIRELFVPAGDPEQAAGEYAGAADLLRAMGDRRAAFAEIGITGYPESHHRISDEETIRAMFEKAPMATCIVSQICFDPAVIAGWIANVRTRGTDLPVWVGVPGCVDYAKLLRISMRIGLGESARFLAAHGSWLRRLIAREFKPGRVVDGLRETFADPAAGVAGLHLYTFNEVGRTERWRQRTLRALTARTG